MSNAKGPMPELKGVPKAEIRSGKRRISVVWLVPLVALAIGGWLAWFFITRSGGGD